MMLETTVDGRYQIVARIAAGGMGEVYRAHDPVLDREVALKILHPSLADDPAFIDRFRREARSAATLSHPNIVAVHDWGETQGTYFMVMEFVRGPNLRAILMRDGVLTPSHAVDVATGVLGALEHAHAGGIVHRDVKPENVMLRAGDGVVKVADFGLARAFADSRVSQAPGTVTGTVQYLAPEQIEGERADPRTDLYAVGIVLYELLTGQVPFTGETSVAIAYRHLRERVPPPSTANPMIPPALDRVVLSATERDRERRLADAGIMRRELTRAAEELPPATTLADLASSVTPADEVPADRLATVTIPRALSPRQRRLRAAARAFRWIAAVVVAAVLGWAVWTFAIPHRTTVPDLVGDPLRTAQAEAGEAGLELAVVREEFHSTVPGGSVISQHLDPGTEAEQGTAVRVVLSKGLHLEPVPDVTGMKEPAAVRRLEGVGFTAGFDREYHDTIPEGTVIEQDPRADTRFEVGQEVLLTVSRGPEPVSVPGVTGLGATDASAILRAEDLTVGVEEEFSADVDRGFVIRQTPAADQSVAPGSTVTIVVSKGPEQFAMPNVIGQSSADARADLEGLGLVVDENQVPGSVGDQVVGQIPKPGATVQAGQQVRIYIG